MQRQVESTTERGEREASAEKKEEKSGGRRPKNIWDPHGKREEI